MRRRCVFGHRLHRHLERSPVGAVGKLYAGYVADLRPGGKGTQLPGLEASGCLALGAVKEEEVLEGAAAHLKQQGANMMALLDDCVASSKRQTCGWRRGQSKKICASEVSYASYHEL